MTTVTTYIELPGTFSEDDEALEVILQQYGLRDWVALCNVTSQSHDGAVVDVEPEMGELYYDPELQTILFTLEETSEVEQEVEWQEELLDPETEEVITPGKWLTETVTEVTHRTRAASFVRKEQEDNNA